MDAPLYRHACVVAFADTDASGWMHFTNAFRFFEEAEHAFLKSRSVLVFDRALGGWPRVSVSCDYKRPLLTGDRIDVLLGISRIGNSSVAWDFEILTDGGGCAAIGSVVTVRVDQEGRPQPITSAERSALTERQP